MQFFALVLVSIFASAAFLIVISYVGESLPFTKGTGFNWWFVLSISAGSIAAACVTAPFLPLLFQRRRWLTALFSTSPLLLLVHSGMYAEILSVCAVYFSLLMIEILLFSFFLKDRKDSIGLKQSKL